MYRNPAGPEPKTVRTRERKSVLAKSTAAQAPARRSDDGRARLTPRALSPSGAANLEHSRALREKRAK